MKQLTLSAPAKINLTLDVLARRVDGYHELSTIMQTVSLCDTVTVEAVRSEQTSVSLRADKSFLPTDERNIAVKAAIAFLNAVGLSAEVRIQIEKRIPIGAGMGGGSTDAAAVLRALPVLLAVEISQERLNRIAMSVGADVPFVLNGGCALAKGIGEALQPISVFEKVPILVCKPRASVSTKTIFSRLNVAEISEHPDTSGTIEAICEKNVSALAFRLFNVLEPVTTEICPIIADYHRQLLKAGALGAAMTGSGTAVFGVFPDTVSAAGAAEQLRSQCDQVWHIETVGEHPPIHL